MKYRVAKIFIFVLKRFNLDLSNVYAAMKRIRNKHGRQKIYDKIPLL